MPVALYQTLLPADIGVALARRVAARIRHDSPVASDDAALGAAAEARLAHGDAEAVVFGHSHVEALRRVRGGLYANPGAWHRTRTFLRGDVDGMALARWSGSGAAQVSAEAWTA